MKNRRHCFNNCPRRQCGLQKFPRDSLKLEISTRRPRKENNPGVTQQYFYCVGKGEVFQKDNDDNDDNVAKTRQIVLRKRYNSQSALWLTGRWGCELLERRMPQCGRFYFSWDPDAAAPEASQKGRPLWSCPVHCCSTTWREHTNGKQCM